MAGKKRPGGVPLQPPKPVAAPPLQKETDNALRKAIESIKPTGGKD